MTVGLEVGARPVRPLAADDELGLRLERPVDHALDLVRLGLRDQRAHVEVVGVGRVAPLDRPDLVGERGDEPVVDRRAGDDAAGRRAVLARVPVAGRLEDLGRELHVGVVEDDDRGLAAELQVEPLDGAGRDLRDVLAGDGVAGDRRPCGPSGGRRAGRPCRRPSPDRTLSDAGGQELGQDQLREAQGGQRRPRRRLEDDRVAGRERRARASRPPCTAGSSTARWRRRRRPGRGGPSRCGRRDTR